MYTYYSLFATPQANFPLCVPSASQRLPQGTREFTKGGLVKGGFAIHAFPLCNCNTLGSVFNVQIENMPDSFNPPL